MWYREHQCLQMLEAGVADWVQHRTSTRETRICVPCETQSKHLLLLHCHQTLPLLPEKFWDFSCKVFVEIKVLNFCLFVCGA